MLKEKHMNKTNVQNPLFRRLRSLRERKIY